MPSLTLCATMASVFPAGGSVMVTQTVRMALMKALNSAVSRTCLRLNFQIFIALSILYYLDLGFFFAYLII